MNGLSSRRTAALLEVLGVTAAGPLLMWAIRQLLQLTLTNPLTTLRADISDHELLVASAQMLELLLFQYAGYFLLAFPLNAWYRHKGLADYGLTRAGLPWCAIGVAALATAALASLPAVGVSVINSLHPGATAGWRQALMDMPPRWQSWLFTAVMSWALVPVLEELFHRGYCLRRLAEDWGQGPAIVAGACLFTFAHSQYFLLNLYNIALLLSLLFFALCVGIAFVLTRSLLPGIATHVVLNLPLPSPWEAVLLAVLLLAAAGAWRHGLRAVKQVLRTAQLPASALLIVVSITYELCMARDALWPSAAAAALLAVALGLQIIERARVSRVPA